MGLIVDFPTRIRQDLTSCSSCEPDDEPHLVAVARSLPQEKMSEPLLVDFPSRHPSRPLHLEPQEREASARGVSWRDDIATTIAVEDLSAEHKSDLWFTQREIEKIKYSAAQLLQLIKSKMTMAEYAELNSDSTEAFMGLENYLSDSGTRQILERRRSVRRAVLREQRRQATLEIYDPDAMADVSEAESDVARRRARIVGLMHL